MKFIRLLWGRVLRNVLAKFVAQFCVVLLFGVLARPASSQDIEAGRKLFNQGILSNGEKLVGVAKGDLTLRGKFVACAKCHRRSGRGAREGARLVPSIHPDDLFKPRRAKREQMFRNLYQEDHPPETDAKLIATYTRQAYSADSLRRVLRQGIDSNGRKLNNLMPKYDIPDSDFKNLLAYMRKKESSSSDRLNEKEIHFAVVVAAKTDPREKQAILEVIHAYADCHNLDTKRFRSRPARSVNYKADFIKTYRTWKIHVWELKNDPETWAVQLKKMQRDRPVFALLGGISAEHWKTIHDFCENEQIPCMLPITMNPYIGENNYTVYLHRGVAEEARFAVEKVVGELKGNTPAESRKHAFVVQLHGQNKMGTSEVSRLLMDKAKLHAIRIQEEKFLRSTYDKLRKASHIFVWSKVSEIQKKVLKSCEDSGSCRVYYSRTCDLSNMGTRSTNRLSRFANPSSLEKTDILRTRKWLSSRGIYDRKYEDIQLSSFAACLLTKHTLRHMVDDFDPDYFVEWAEHECESISNPGPFPVLSLAPGQRFAASLYPND